MKTFYFFLILLFSFSFANAQSTESRETQATVVAVKESKEVAAKTTIILEPSVINEAVARSSSDIRIYLNRERKVQNIKLLFPKINKARKA